MKTQSAISCKNLNKLKLNILLASLLSVGINCPVYSETVTVTVPSTASGGFGTPRDYYGENWTPLVKALSVKKAGTITISYQSGTEAVSDTPQVGWCGAGEALCYGPNGGGWDAPYGWELPLSQESGASVHVTNVMALIGAFVPESLVKENDFQALDGTRVTSGVGIMPDKLFFVGSYNVIQVSGPGTLYLGVNDMIVDDNVGSLAVEVSGQNGHGDHHGGQGDH